MVNENSRETKIITTSCTDEWLSEMTLNEDSTSYDPTDAFLQIINQYLNVLL